MHIFKPPKWLIVFADKSNGENIKHFLNLVGRFQEKLKVNILNNLTCRELEGDFQTPLGEFCKTMSGEGEARNLLDEFLMNEVVALKKREKCNKAAVVFTINQFANPDSYRAIIGDPYFDDTTFFCICSRRDFFVLNPKVDHVDKQCGNCPNNSNCGIHSCLPRLLWLVFERDNRVIEELKSFPQAKSVK